VWPQQVPKVPPSHCKNIVNQCEAPLPTAMGCKAAINLILSITSWIVILHAATDSVILHAATDSVDAR